MCLDTVSKEKPEPTGVGYKVFEKPGRLLQGEFSTGSRKTKTWLEANDYTANDSAAVIGEWSENYPLGFHIYPLFKDALDWLSETFSPNQLSQVVRKVKYCKAHTAGRINHLPVIVAAEIYIYPGEV